MSQVRKLQGGGTPKLGSITIDGRRYEGTPETIQALSSYLANKDLLSGIIRDIQDGNDLVYTSSGNTISGLTQKNSGVSERDFGNRGTGTSEGRKRWQAFMNSDPHRFREQLYSLGGFYIAPKQEISTPTNLTDIYGNKVWYSYGTDENGNRKYLANDPNNVEIQNRIRLMTDYMKNPDDVSNKTYKLGDYYTPQLMSALRQVYNTYQANAGQEGKQDWNTYLEGLKSRAMQGEDSITDEDKAFLKYFNIVPGKVAASEEGTTPTLSSTDKTKWKNAGYNDELIKLLGPQAVLNEDGTLSMREGNDWNLGISDLQGRNIHFNQNFFERYTDPRYKPFSGYTLYNGRLYTPNSEALRDILNANGGFNSLMRAGNFDAADDLISFRFTDAAKKNPGYIGTGSYVPFLNSQSHRYINLTGVKRLDSPDYDENSNQIIGYFDLNKPVESNSPYNYYDYKYALLDKYGNWIKDLTKEDLKDVPGGQERDLTTYKAYTGVDNTSPYFNSYYQDILDAKGQETGYRIARKKKGSKNEGDVIITIPDIKAEGADAATQDILIPEELAKYIFKNDKMFDTIVKDKEAQRYFARLISHIIQKAYVRSGGSSLSDNGITTSQLKEFLKLLGHSEQDATDAISVLERLGSEGSSDERKYKYLLTRPTEMKEGGVLKHQFGGFAVGSTTSKGVSETRTNTEFNNVKNAAGISDIGTAKWGSTDTMELGALLGDLVSLGFAFAPGANVGSAIAGFGSSTARYAADKQRGTSGAELNYLLNLGMDAATLIPFLGGASKSFKAVRAIKRALPTIIKAASIYGLSDAVVTSAKKIANGEKWSVRDVSNVINGITAGVGVRRSGVSMRGAKDKGKLADAVTLTGKNNTSKVKLTKKEVTDLKGKTKDEITSTLFNREVAKHPALTKEDFAEQFGEAIENLVKNNSKKTWSPELSLNPRKWVKTTSDKFNPELKTVKDVPRETETGFSAWMKGRTQRARDYRDSIIRPESGQFKERRTISIKGGFADKQINVDGKAIKLTKKEIEGIMNIKDKGLKQYESLISLVQSKVPNASREQVIAGIAPFLTHKNGNIVANFKPRTLVKQKTLVPRKQYGLALPQWIKEAPIDVKNEQPAGFVPYPRFKKGGIIKGQKGLPEIEIPDIPEYNPDITINYATLSVPTGKELLKKYNIKPIIKSKTQNNGILSGGTNTETPIPDLTIPLNLARTLYSMGQSDKQLKNFLSRPLYQQQSTSINVPRFVTSGTGDAYRSLAKASRLYQPVTSDATLNDINQRARQQQAFELEMKGTLADSEEFKKWLANAYDITQKNTLRNTEVANQNAYARNNYATESILAKNQNIAEKSKFVDTFGYALQDWLNRQTQMKRQYQISKDIQTELQPRYSALESEWRDLNAKYQNDTSNPYYQSQLALLRQRKQDLDNQVGGITAKYQIGMWKKGAKTTATGKDSKVTYSRDPYPELLLQNAKDSTKMVEKLNDSVIKLILQTKPIHVS